MWRDSKIKIKIACVREAVGDLRLRRAVEIVVTILIIARVRQGR